jgi:formylglycine-generating enzyme required for sulfatase activity
MMLRVAILSLLLLSACRSIVSLPGGTVRIGTSAEELQRFRAMHPRLSDRLFEAEQPERMVAIAPFAIDQHEVTNEAFARFARTSFDRARARHPVVNVTWQQADGYCRWRRGRLPTEAEWEYAARGGRERQIFPWGDDPPDPAKANYAASGLRTTTPAGSYPPNGYGLHDMSGNVWEWTAGRWPGGGEARYVIRGGSWGGAPVNLRVAYRDSHRAADAREFVGFRCVY